MHKRSFKPRQGGYLQPGGGSGGFGDSGSGDSGSYGSNSIHAAMSVSHGSNVGNSQMMIRIVPVPMVLVIIARMVGVRRHHLK